ncbi:MAG: kelch repeat-containing protein, partial [Bacteroidota bacterium]
FNTISKRIEVLDLNTNLISEVSENPNPVKSAGSAVWNNKIYIFGGQNIYGYTDNFYEYDPSKDTWQKLPDLPERKQTTGKIIEGILYVFGGYNGSISFENIYAYDIKESTWTKVGELPFYLSANAAVSDGRNIWLVGSYLDTYLLAAYDTKTNTVSKFDSNMINRRHAGAQIMGGTLYIFGGNQNANILSALSNTEYTDIANQKK